MIAYRFYRTAELYFHSMPTVVPIRNPQTVALNQIRRLAADSSKVALSKHASVRMKQRGFTMIQVLRCLVGGEPVDGPTLDSVDQMGWVCRLRHVSAGVSIEVVCKLVEQDDEYILVITTI